MRQPWDIRSNYPTGSIDRIKRICKVSGENSSDDDDEIEGIPTFSGSSLEVVDREYLKPLIEASKKLKEEKKVTLRIIKKHIIIKNVIKKHKEKLILYIHKTIKFFNVINEANLLSDDRKIKETLIRIENLRSKKIVIEYILQFSNGLFIKKRISEDDLNEIKKMANIFFQNVEKIDNLIKDIEEPKKFAEKRPCEDFSSEDAKKARKS